MYIGIRGWICFFRFVVFKRSFVNEVTTDIIAFSASMFFTFKPSSYVDECFRGIGNFCFFITYQHTFPGKLISAKISDIDAV